MRVLIIDDKPHFRRMLRTWFVQEGHDVHDADGGPETFQLLGTFQYDVVTLDLLMPQANGLTMIEEIRRIAPRTHIIVISGEANTRVAVESIKSGAAACIEKPVDFDALKDEMVRLEWLSSEMVRA